MGDKRSATRQRTYKGGLITFDAGRSTITCLVCNLSTSGACLAVETPVGIPATFKLVFSSGGPPRDCRVVWSQASRIGVEFQ